jgi:hypothetical protein
MNGEPTITIRVDPTNPGQFFACCGLLELAERFWQGAAGYFAAGHFCLLPCGAPADPSLDALVGAVTRARLIQLDPDDEFSSRIELGSFGLRLDWWHDGRSGGGRLKVWAGSMRSVRIAAAMKSALGDAATQGAGLLDYAAVVHEPDNQTKKVEPYYFDARRGSNALPLDVGFSPDSLGMTTRAYPAVEFLCLVGLQRFRPMPTDRARVFEYQTWGQPLPCPVAPLAACGVLSYPESRCFRFENAFRTDQRKHKAFTSATSIGRSL